MACMKLGSKADVFERRGQDWVCTTGLPSDVTVEVGENFFHLHKFPLLSKSTVLERLIKEKSDNGEEDCIIPLPDLPGGAKAFELVAIFCYGAKLEISASNVALLRCAAEHLDMTEDISEGNLISQTENFLNQAVLQSWNDSLKVLQTCDALLPHAEDLQIVNRCIESLAMKACRDPSLFSWPVIKYGSMQSPGGSILWNGISTGARLRDCSSDWWFEDAATLSLPMYKRLILVMESRTKEEIIAGSLTFYAKRYLPGLSRRQINGDTSMKPVLSEEEQRHLLEEIDRLLPLEKGLSPTKLLFGLLRTSMIIGTSPSCKSNLERRIGMQLEEATLEDLLMPSFSCSMETLYDIDCVQRILEHFLTMDRANGSLSPCFDDDEQFLGSPCLMPITSVGKLIDGYLAEVAPDSNLKLPKFEALAGAIPDYARPLDDGLYRAIDIYLKAHPWLTESEREQLCHLMDCQKLSLEACTHAAQNERLPLRVVVQVLFFEQLQLRSSIAGCFLFSDNLDGGSKPLLNGGAAVAPGEAAIRENQVLKVGMDSMRWRVAELEKECSSMREEIDKLGKGGGKSRAGTWEKIQKKLGIKIKSQMCSAEVESVRKRKDDIAKVEKWKANLIAKQQQLHIEE